MRLKVVHLEEPLFAGTSVIKAASFAFGRFENWSQPGVLGDGKEDRDPSWGTNTPSKTDYVTLS